MSNRKTTHATFTISRAYSSPPERVFRAFGDVEAKAKWFAGPNGWRADIRQMDFRPGGEERVRGIFADGHTSDFRARYHEIVPNERIVYVYDMYTDEQRLSVSLATIELRADGKGTVLTITEQGVFFDERGESDVRSREAGTKWLVDKIGASLGE